MPKMCPSKPGGQNFTNVGAHALEASMNENLNVHIDWCKWAGPIHRYLPF